LPSDNSTKLAKFLRNQQIKSSQLVKIFMIKQAEFMNSPF